MALLAKWISHILTAAEPIVMYDENIALGKAPNKKFHGRDERISRDDRTVILCDPDPVLFFKTVPIQAHSNFFFKC